MQNPFFIDADYEVQGLSKIPYTAHIQITQTAWAAADPDVQRDALNILNAPPIQLLPLNGKGNGIKRESNGWTIHTQTDKRLYDTDTSGGGAPKTFLFDTYKKAPH